MDDFKVPKKVNRHVLKALNFLSRNNENVPTSLILNQVKYQMRNLVPVPNIDMVIQKSLKNLSDIGLIDRIAGKKYAIGKSYVPPTAPNKPKAAPGNLFKPIGSRKRSASQLDPNARRIQYDSEDSLSGDDYDRARKRMRSNTKKINYLGRNTELPKAKQHYRFKTITLARTSPLFNIMNDYENDNELEENFNMAVYIGAETNSNTEISLPSSSSRQALEITEIFNETTNELTNLPVNNEEIMPEVVELYKNSKNITDEQPSTFNSNHTTPAKTSVESVLEKTTKSKTSVQTLETPNQEN